MLKHGSLCHVEYLVSDLARSQAYFEGMFGWDFRQYGDTMVVFGQGDDHIGGLSTDGHEASVRGSSPSLWFKVDSLEAASERSVQLGGSAMSERHPVPGVGWSAVVHDLDGNAVGLVQYDD
jgi:predicted enzyme related to lactoylglutathione lyase